MEPGRELDAEIANKVFGIPTNRFHEVIGPPGLGVGAAHKYSTDMESAWLVVEKIGFAGTYMRPDPDYGWVCQFGDKGGAYAKTLPHAICLAALKIVDKKADN